MSEMPMSEMPMSELPMSELPMSELPMSQMPSPETRSEMPMPGRALKVAMVLGRSTGGIGTHVAQLSADLRARHTDVVVVTDSLTAGRFELGDVRVWWPRPGPAGALVRSWRDLRNLRRLASSSDVVHAHGHQAGLLAAAVTIGLRSRPRLVVSHHNAVLADSGGLRLKAAAQRWVARRADLVTGASSDLVEQARWFGARAARLAPVPSPKVPDLLDQAPADQAERARERALLLAGTDAPSLAVLAGWPMVVTVSRVAPQKNLPVLVEAAARLQHPCVWVVVGDGEQALLDALRNDAARLAAPVRFVGARPDVARWLRAADVFVLPSQWEARALVVQEAMAAGTPVVASDVGGLRDLVDGVGLLVPVGDAAAVAAATDRVLGDPSLRERLAGVGRAAAVALPDGDDTADQWLVWYCEPAPMT